MNTTQFIDQARNLIVGHELGRVLLELGQFPANTAQLDAALHQSGCFAAIRKQITSSITHKQRNDVNHRI